MELREGFESWASNGIRDTLGTRGEKPRSNCIVPHHRTAEKSTLESGGRAGGTYKQHRLLKDPAVVKESVMREM